MTVRARSLFAPLALASASTLMLVSACEDDPAPAGTQPSLDASSDSERPDGATPPDDAAADAGFDPIDLAKIGWETFPTLPLDGVRVGSECDVAFDADDRVLVTYGESAPEYAPPRSLSVFRYEAPAWTVLGGAPLVSDSPSGPVRARLAVAKDGTVYVSYTQGGAAVVQRFSGGAWTPLPPPGFTLALSIEVDAAGLPVVVGRDGSATNMLRRFDGTAWSAPISPVAVDPDASPGPTGQGMLHVALRPDGDLAVVAVVAKQIQAFVLSGTTWSPLGAAFAVGDYPDIASSPAGGIAAAWSSEDNVHAAAFDPAMQAFVPLGGGLGGPSARYAVTAIDPFDRPFVAWREQGIKVTAFAGGAPHVLPDPPSDRGTLPAIAVDRRGLPGVCWEAGRDAGTGSAIGVARGVVR